MDAAPDRTSKYQADSLSLIGAVAMGTGVMIGAGIFALTGQIAELAGPLFPFAFVAGAVITGFSAYSYVRMSNAWPSSGGIAMILLKCYGPGAVAGGAALLMALSMVIAEGADREQESKKEGRALAIADIGIAIGGGADVAVVAGHCMVLARLDPRDIPRIITLSRATYRKMVQNLWWAAGYIIFAIPLAAGVLALWGILLTPAVGAILMSASTVVVAISAQL